MSDINDKLVSDSGKGNGNGFLHAKTPAAAVAAAGGVRRLQAGWVSASTSKWAASAETRAAWSASFSMP